MFNEKGRLHHVMLKGIGTKCNVEETCTTYNVKSIGQTCNV